MVYRLHFFFLHNITNRAPLDNGALEYRLTGDRCPRLITLSP
jgi:hypothetical protein